MQRPAALVGAGVRVGTVLEQPGDGLRALVLRCVHKRLVEDVLREFTRRQPVQPAHVRRVRPVDERVGGQTAVGADELLEPVDPARAGRDPRRVRHERDRRQDVDGCAGGVMDRGLERGHAVDPADVHARPGGEQDLDQLDAVEARRQVERAVELAAAFDQEVDAGAIHAERVPERRSEHIRLRDLAEQRPARSDLDVYERGLEVEQPLERSRIPRADRVQGGRDALGVPARTLPSLLCLAHAVDEAAPGREPVLAGDDQPSVGARGQLGQRGVAEGGEPRDVRTHTAQRRLVAAGERPEQLAAAAS